MVTSGWRSSQARVAVSPRHPVGRVSRVDSDERELYQRVHLTPFADLRELDIVEVLTRDSRRGPERAGCSVNVSVGTVVRLTVLVVAVVVLQLAVVAQIVVFDASADLLPLVALSIGLLAGPVAGATVGFLLGPAWRTWRCSRRSA